MAMDIQPSQTKMSSFYRHFSRIAHRYKDLRAADIEPVLSIKRRLRDRQRVQAADVGCGPGLYGAKLFKVLGRRLHLTCVDSNHKMLQEVRSGLSKHRRLPFATVRASAEQLPFADSSLDSVFTFNAVHHFKLAEFLNEACRVLRPRGLLFLYTRLRSQNKKHIWGTHFPGFWEKEDRLHELPDFERALEGIGQLQLLDCEYFSYERMSSVERLMELAKSHHYSTFLLYHDGEFERALEQFRRNLSESFGDPRRISWRDENIMLVIQKSG